MMIRETIKNLIAYSGFRVVNRTRRWGIDFVDDVTRMVTNPTALQVIFDVGANVGATSLSLAAAFPNSKIYAFEPVAETFAKLSQNTAKTDCIIPVHRALGELAGTAAISLFGDSGKSSLQGVMEDHFHSQLSGTEEIEVDTVDSVMEKQRIEYVDLLKTDTEGHDLSVLKGAKQALSEHKIGFIYTEFHHLLQPDEGSGSVLGSLEEIAKFLRAFNYRYVCSYTDSVHCDEDIGTHNALFARGSLGTSFHP